MPMKTTDRFFAQSRGSVEEAMEPGEELTCVGFARSEEVDGDDRWLRTRGPDRMWIHAGGVAESI